MSFCYLITLNFQLQLILLTE